MKYRKFSDLGWNVSEIGLGCWQIGWCWGDLVTERDVKKLLKQALDSGINFYDTSDTYGDGRSEKADSTDMALQYGGNDDAYGDDDNDDYGDE